MQFPHNLTTLRVQQSLPLYHTAVTEELSRPHSFVHPPTFLAYTNAPTMQVACVISSIPTMTHSLIFEASPLMTPQQVCVNVSTQVSEALLSPPPGRLPKQLPFSFEAPTRWFAIAEQIFDHYSLDDSACYICLITHLRAYINSNCKLVNYPPATDWYSITKQTILERATHMPENTIRHIIHEEHLGDKKLSQLWSISIFSSMSTTCRILHSWLYG